MNTHSVAKVTSATALALLLGALATSYAGPGPQYWNKSSSPAKPASQVPVACAGCKDRPILAMSDRGPAGKGASSASVIGKMHECKDCTGNIMTEKGKVRATMAHSNACALLACCK